MTIEELRENTYRTRLENMRRKVEEYEERNAHGDSTLTPVECAYMGDVRLLLDKLDEAERLKAKYEPTVSCDCEYGKTGNPFRSGSGHDPLCPKHREWLARWEKR